MTNVDLFRINFGLILDEAAVAATVNFHSSAPGHGQKLLEPRLANYHAVRRSPKGNNSLSTARPDHVRRWGQKRNFRRRLIAQKPREAHSSFGNVGSFVVAMGAIISMAEEGDRALEGGCTCAAVRYRMTSRPMFVHCCHCRWCQRETGASFALNAIIEADRVILLQGQPETVETPSNSGKGQKIVRCPDCRVALWSHYAGAGETMCFVRVGIR